MTFAQSLEKRKRDIQNRRPNADLHLSAAILMFSVIRADGDTDHLELAHMVDILRSRYALTGEEISSLIAAVRSSIVDDHGLGLLAEKLSQHWRQSARKQLLNDLWILATADQKIRLSEIRIINLIAEGLGLSAEDIERAQHKAEQRLELTSG